MMDKARKIVVAVVAAVAVLWTLAGLVTLVYWSGLALWVCAAVALTGFAWTLRVYLRPTVVPAEVSETSTVRRSTTDNRRDGRHTGCSSWTYHHD